ncbi:Gfo/Idh/MocA family protein [Anaerocolumna chitinilytica]|uniref:Gfo/Idh/MocA family oxidoreductase n=1 Tax=Anaerocolumna chitinilytica TaxID=1727145 RepID=A0A7I8DGF5_9FIRM|nr:Gfo/Idh/MocA family oxidoreductase [Anaerocolumna chitinilytica]BCJ97470.1 hypothetical protein bsdcttw_05110 [Anaerocolumna chitinilytica]
MRIGVIGCGGMGITHMLSLKTLAAGYDIEVIAVADVRKTARNKALEVWPGAMAFGDGLELLEAVRVEMVVICLPSYLHTKYAVKAMEMGIHVFLEKPVCLKEEDCKLLLKTQEETGAKVLVGQVVRMMDEYHYLKKLIDDKSYGKLKSITLWRLSGLVDWGYENWFRDMNRSGSVVLDLHIHDVDFLRYILGEPDRIHVNARKNSEGMPEQVITQYQFKEVIASAEAIWDNPQGFPFEAGFRAVFENATLAFNNTGKDKLIEYHKDGKINIPDLNREFQATDHTAGINISEMGPYCIEMKYFLDCLIQKKEIEVLPLVEGVGSVRLCLKELELALNCNGNQE